MTFNDVVIVLRLRTALKLCRLMVYSKFHTICQFVTKPCDKKLYHDDVITISNRKQKKNAALQRTKQNIYHSNGFVERYSKV